MKGNARKSGEIQEMQGNERKWKEIEGNEWKWKEMKEMERNERK